jgi:hypothetical protein
MNKKSIKTKLTSTASPDKTSGSLNSSLACSYAQSSGTPYFYLNKKNKFK